MHTPDEMRQFVETYIRAFNARDLDTVVGLYAPDATLEDPVGSGLHRGTSAIRSFYERYRDQPSFLQLTGDFRYAADALAFSFFCYLGSGTEPTIVQITDTFRFDPAGRIREMRAFWGHGNIHGIDAERRGNGLQLPMAGRCALIVGNGPIAGESARRLGARGAVVVVAGVEAQSEVVAESIRKQGGRAFGVPIRIDRPAELVALSETAMRLCGRLDMCLNALEDGRTNSASLTRLCSSEQSRAFDSAGGTGAIVNVISMQGEKARYEEGRPGATRVARINYILASGHVSADAVSELAAFLLSPAAIAVRDQLIALGDPV